MICLVTVLDTLTHPYSMLYPTPSPSLCPWVKFCTHSQRGLGWCLCASYIWMVPCRDSAVTIYRIDQVVLMLWLLLHSQSYWPCSSGVVSFAETVEAPANGNQVKIWKFSYSRLSTESVFTAYLNDIVVLICDIVNHCFFQNVLAETSELHCLHTLKSLYGSWGVLLPVLQVFFWLQRELRNVWKIAWRHSSYCDNRLVVSVIFHTQMPGNLQLRLHLKWEDLELIFVTRGSFYGALFSTGNQWLRKDLSVTVLEFGSGRIFLSVLQNKNWQLRWVKGCHTQLCLT